MSDIHPLVRESLRLIHPQAFGKRGRRWFPGKSKLRHEIHDKVVRQINELHDAGVDLTDVLNLPRQPEVP